MWKELEEQRRKEELDPAKEAGSVLIELPGSDPGVQRLRALGDQVRAQSGQPSGLEAAQTGLLEQPKETEASADKAADSASLSREGMHQFPYSQLKRFDLAFWNIMMTLM